MPTIAEMMRQSISIIDETYGLPEYMLGCPAEEDEEFEPATVPEYGMRVAPGTDAVVWKLCDTNETVEL